MTQIEIIGKNNKNYNIELSDNPFVYKVSVNNANFDSIISKLKSLGFSRAQGYETSNTLHVYGNLAFRLLNPPVVDGFIIKNILFAIDKNKNIIVLKRDKAGAYTFPHFHEQLDLEFINGMYPNCTFSSVNPIDYFIVTEIKNPINREFTIKCKWVFHMANASFNSYQVVKKDVFFTKCSYLINQETRDKILSLLN